MENDKQKNIYLIGFMGCGKTTMAHLLSQELGKERIEMDETIEKEEGQSINAIFETKGETYFRDLESSLIQRITECGDKIISCGGGVILRSENVDNMKKNGTIVYLKATPETIYERVHKSTHRPLLNGNMNVEYIKTLMEKRIAAYEMAADITICVDGKEKESVLQEILEKIIADLKKIN